MVRTCYVLYEDNDGAMHEFQVEFEVLFDNEDDNIRIISIKENEGIVTLNEEELVGIKNLCFEDYDDENWEYDE